MTSGSYSTRSAIDFALSHSRDVDVINGIKAAVVNEIERLDPTLEVRATDYFNHSYVPDLVANWRRGGRAEERGVYLRFTMRAAVLGGDVRALGSDGPMFIALREDVDDASVKEDARRDVGDSPRALVTDVPALDKAVTTAVEELGSPLLSLVRSNIIRGGRGLLDSDNVDELVDTTSWAGSASENVANLDRFSSLVDEMFIEDSAASLRRASNIIQLGNVEDIDAWLLENEQIEMVGGSLSDVELALLLPYLLSRSAITNSTRYWRYIGSLMDLDRLEDISSRLASVDLTPLVSANLEHWLGLRASLTMQADETEGEQSVEGKRSPEIESEALVARRAGWFMHGGTLALNLPNWRLHLATNGKRLRGRGDSQSARWDDLRDAVSSFSLRGVTLQGVVRTVDVAAERDVDVRADVAKISESLEDSFYVPRAEVLANSPDGAVPVEVDFRKMLATANQRVAIGDLARISINLLGHRYPVDANVQAGYFGS